MTRDDLLTYNGITQPITEWALDYGITPETILTRLSHGMKVGRAITKPMLARPGDKLPEFNRRPNAATPRKEPGRLYDFNGQSLTLKEWAAKLGITTHTLRHRLKTDHAPEVIFSPARPPHHKAIMATIDGKAVSYLDLCRMHNVPRNTLYNRLKAGWSLDRALTTPSRSRHHRGEGSNFQPLIGTGGGSTAQESAEIDFSQEAT